MKTIIVTPKNDSELKFISELLKKLGVSSRILTQSDKEDIGMSILMHEVNRKEKVSESEIMKKLKSQ